MNNLIRLATTVLLTFSISGIYSQIQPPACSNTVIPVSAAIQNFYDPGGIGGNPCVPDVANNYPNSGCITSYQFVSPIGTTVLVDFSVLSMYNTVNGWDWMVVYDGGNNASPILFDNRAGAPDNDAYNEYFRPVFTSGFDPYDFNLFIFNRWGEIIWESHDASVGWDGTYNGRVVSDGTYSWKIEFKTSANDQRMMVNGHVNVIR